MVKIKNLIWIFVLIIYCTCTYAQGSISGRLVDKDKKGISTVTIVLMDKTYKLIGFTYSSEDGSFDLASYKCQEGSYLLFNHLSYDELKIYCVDLKDDSEIELKEVSYKLEEQVIIGNRIRKPGDTLVYQMDEYRSAEDFTLEEILAKIPGITIETDGKISYNGLPISKFYIENMDMLKGNYDYVTRKLNPELIEAVEVLTNHQHKRILQGIEIPEKAAINIRLKKKRLVNSNIQLGSSVGDANYLYGSTTFGFFKKVQFNLNLFSTNAGRTDPNGASDLYADRGESIAKAFPRSLNVNSIMPPNLKIMNYLDNNLAQGNATILLKPSLNHEFTVKLGYQYEKIRNVGSRELSYLLEGFNFAFTDTLNQSNKKNAALLNLNHEYNSKKFYANTKAVITLANNSTLGDNILNGSNVYEALKDNDLNIDLVSLVTIKYKGKPLDIKFKINQANKEQDLSLLPLLFNDPQFQSVSFPTGNQTLGIKATNFNASNFRNIKFGEKSVVVTYGVEASRLKFESNLTVDSIGEARDLGAVYRNDYQNFEYRAFLTPATNLRMKGFNLSINLPMDYKGVYADKAGTKINSISGFTTKPKISLEKWFGSIEYGYSTDFLASNTAFAEGYFLSSYRSLTRGNFAFTRVNGHNLNLNMAFGSPASWWFTSFGSRYQTLVTNLQENSLLSSLGEGSSFVRGRSETKSYGLNNKSQFLAWQRSLKVEFISDLSRFNPQLAINSNAISPYLLRGSIKGNVQYLYGQTVWTVVNQLTHIGNGTSSRKLFSSQGEFFINLMKQGKVSLMLEAYNNFGISQNNLLNFTYKRKIMKPKMDIEIQGVNLLNNANFTNLSRGIINEDISVYRLRGRQILFTTSFNL